MPIYVFTQTYYDEDGNVAVHQETALEDYEFLYQGFTLALAMNFDVYLPSFEEMFKDRELCNLKQVIKNEKDKVIALFEIKLKSDQTLH